MLRVWNNELNWNVVEYSEFNYLGCTINFRMTLFLFFVFSRRYRSLYRFDFHSKFVLSGNVLFWYSFFLVRRRNYDE